MRLLTIGVSIYWSYPLGRMHRCWIWIDIGPREVISVPWSKLTLYWSLLEEQLCFVPTRYGPIGTAAIVFFSQVSALSRHQILGLLDVILQHRIVLDVHVDFSLEYHVGDHLFLCKFSGISIGWRYRKKSFNTMFVDDGGTDVASILYSAPMYPKIRLNVVTKLSACFYFL